MTPLEIRIVLYAVLAMGIIGGSAWTACTLTSHHYERIMAADKLAQDTALQGAQQQVIAAQQAQAAAIQQAEKDHAVLVQADTASRDAVLGSVRSLEAALHLSSLPTSVGHSGQSGGAASGSGGDSGIETLFGRLNASIEKATAACQHDSAELAGILEIAPR